jgi:membrane protease YdiL (CAAX protease family)
MKRLEKYIILVFVISFSFWVLGAIYGQKLPLPLSLPISAFSFICPMIAAIILVRSENGPGGINLFIKGFFDLKRIRSRRWLITIFLLMPAILLASYLIMIVLGRSIPWPQVSLLDIPILFSIFFIGALGEEAGWSGYAAEPMLDRWTALRASVILGFIWATWHIIPFIQTSNSLVWIAWQSFFTIMFRVLITWIFVNTGKSVLAAILCHASYNVSVSLFPIGGSYYDPAITGVVTGVVVIIIVFLWGSKTFTRYRYKSTET